MRINPAIPIMVASLALIASLGSAGTSKTIKVDCSKGQSINKALQDKAEELTIEISGMCQERVVVTRHNVTLIGSDPATDGITGPALDDPWVQRALVRVNDWRNVRLENLTITGSEARGLEGNGFATLDVVNCRITGNQMRGAQFNDGGSANLLDTVVEENGGFELATWTGGLISCTRCTVQDDDPPHDSFLVTALLGGRLFFYDSSLSTAGYAAVLSGVNASVYGQNTDVTAAEGSLYASESAQLNWTGGVVSGSIWADWASQVFLTGVTQTAYSALEGNAAYQDSHFDINGGTFLGDTRISGFSSGTAVNSPSFGTISCDSGGDLYCDGSEAKTGSTCGLCP